MKFVSTLLLVFSLSLNNAAIAQDKAQNKTIYNSSADDLITIRKIAVLPFFDNLQSIYARPVEDYMREYLANDHRFEEGHTNYAGPLVTPDSLEEDPSIVKSIADSTDADAFVATKIIKGPSGMAIYMSMYLKKDLRLISRAESVNLQRTEIEPVKAACLETYKKLLKPLPYEGLIMSRQGTRVTLNLGAKDGIVVDQTVPVIQIQKLNRHPKFNFLISTERMNLGSVKILKVDDGLSFGRIVSEIDVGAIQVGSKIARLEFITYPNSNTLSENPTDNDALAQKPENNMTFGKNPTEWLPTRNPTFGAVGARIGLGQFSENVKRTNDTLQADAPFYPVIALEGELWLTPEWTIHTSIRQGIISTKNPVKGGQPKDISHSLSAYELLFGWNMRIGQGIWAPRVEALAGFSSYRLYVDQSTPAGLTTKEYGGIKMGVAGSYTLGSAEKYAAGAELFFFYNPKLSESPTSSGSSKNSINQFGLFVDQKLKINLKARYALNFELYASDFKGGSASSSSQTHTTGTAGIYYMF